MTLFNSLAEASAVADQNQKDDPNWKYTAKPTGYKFRNENTLISYIEVKDEEGVVMGNL